MPRLTEAEYAAMEEKITRSPPDVDPAKARYPRRESVLIAVDDFSAEWLRIKAEAGHTTPTQVIHTLVAHELADANA